MELGLCRNGMSERYNALRFACLYRARNNVDGFWIRGASSLKALLREVPHKGWSGIAFPR